MTEHYTKLRDKVKMRGIPLTEPEISHIEGLLPIGKGTQEKKFFTCSLDKIRLSGDTTYWHIIRDRLPTRLRQFIPDEDDDDTSQEGDDNNLSNDGKDYEGKIGNPDDVIDYEVATAAVGVGGNAGNDIVIRKSEYMVPSSPGLSSPGSSSKIAGASFPPSTIGPFRCRAKMETASSSSRSNCAVIASSSASSGDAQRIVLPASLSSQPRAASVTGLCLCFGGRCSRCFTAFLAADDDASA